MAGNSIKINSDVNTVNIQPDINKITVVNPDGCSVNITQPVTNVIQVATPGPQGPAGPAGPSGSFETGSFVTTSSFNTFTSVYKRKLINLTAQTGSYVLNSQTGSFATTGSNNFIGDQVITGSLTVSGSSTFTNIGPAIFSGSVNVSSSIETDTLKIRGGVGNEGTFSWNSVDNTVDLRLNDVTLQLGQETVYHVINQTGTQINNGEVVYVVGVSSDKLSVAPYSASMDVEADLVLGLATEDIPDTQFGFITQFGMVRDINTSGFGVGTILYADTGSSGYTDITPTPPNHTIFLGFVTKEDATEGQIELNVRHLRDADEIKTNLSGSGLSSTNVQAALLELDANKVNVGALSSNIILYPTTGSSPIPGYFRMVSDITDPDYNTTAVDINTGAISSSLSGQLIASLASDEGLFVGNPGIINVTTLGNIRKVSGNRDAYFYYELYQSSSSGETLIATSDNTPDITNTSYEEFFAGALLNNGIWSATDRVVIKYYGIKATSGGNDPTYQFQFGGDAPVRTLLPVPVSVVPSEDADGIQTDISNFNNILSGGDTDVQKALDTLDDHSHTLQQITDQGNITTDRIIVGNLTVNTDTLYTSGSNIGIGTTNLPEKLTVEGNISASGNITILGDLDSANFHTGTSTLVGIQSGDNNLGIQLTSLGYQSGLDNSANFVSVLGYRAGYQNTGIYLSSLGYSAGRENTGDNQSSLGYTAGFRNTGDNITVVGYQAGRENSGNNIIAIGHQAGYLNTLDNQFIVRHSTANTIPLIQGNFESGSIGIGLTLPQSNLHVAGDIWASGSNGHITASGNISSSGIVYGITGSFSHLQGNSPITVGDPTTFQLGITGSNILLTSSIVDFDTEVSRSAQAAGFGTGGGGGGISAVVDDPSPQLGGNLDLNSQDITGTGNISIDTTSTATPSLLLTSTNDTSDASPIIDLKRNSSSPSNGDYLGQIKFKGENDANQEVVYAKITGKISDVTDTTEDGLIEFATKQNGSNVINARLTSTDLKLINGTGLEVDSNISASGDISAITGSFGYITGQVSTITWTVDFTDGELNTTLYAPYNLAINSVTNIYNSPTTAISSSGSPYTLGNAITTGEPIDITVSTGSVINLNITR